MDLILASLIVIVSTALLLFYLESLCRSILRREFERPCFESIVRANQLDFPCVRKALEEEKVSLGYSEIRLSLQCDFLALAFLLEHAAKVRSELSAEERLMLVYFRVSFLFLKLRHATGMRGKSGALKLTSILRFLAQAVGQLVSVERSGGLAASESAN